MDQDDFEAWLAHPITERVMAELEQRAKDVKDYWVRISWDGGVVDVVELAKLKAQADAYQEIADMDFSIIEGREDEQARNNSTH